MNPQIDEQIIDEITGTPCGVVAVIVRDSVKESTIYIALDAHGKASLNAIFKKQKISCIIEKIVQDVEECNVFHCYVTRKYLM